METWAADVFLSLKTVHFKTWQIASETKQGMHDQKSQLYTWTYFDILAFDDT